MRSYWKSLVLTIVVVLPASSYAQQAVGDGVSGEPLSARTIAEGYIAQEDWGNARTHCTSWLAAVERRVNDDSEALIDPLLCLGISSLSLDDYSSAIENYNRAIKLTEKHRGVFSGDLVAPLEGLGTALMKMRKH